MPVEHKNDYASGRTRTREPERIGFARMIRSLVATGLGLALCVVPLLPPTSQPAHAAEPISILVGAPRSDQLSRFTEQVTAGMKPMPTVSFVPGLGGAYALRDAAADPAAVVLFSLPGFLLSRGDPSGPAHHAELEAVVLAARVSVALWIPENSTIKTLPDLITQARRGAGTVVCAGPGRFTAPHLASVLFNREAGVLTLFMPLIGTDEARAAAMQGRVQAMWAYALVPGSLPGMRPLAVAAENRSPVLPDVPTFAELGLKVTISAELGFALSPKSKTKATTAAALKAALADSYTQDALARQGFLPIPATDEPLRPYLDEQAERLKTFKRDYPSLLE